MPATNSIPLKPLARRLDAFSREPVSLAISAAFPNAIGAEAPDGGFAAAPPVAR
jgi:hypothetical protein